MNTNVLFVDEEEGNRRFYKNNFEQRGFTVETASTAEEAFELLNKKELHVIAIEMILPGMDGIELCKKISSNGSSVFLTAVTGNPTKLEFSNCMKAGFDAYFAKPLNLDKLAEVIRQRASR